MLASLNQKHVFLGHGAHCVLCIVIYSGCYIPLKQSKMEYNLKLEATAFYVGLILAPVAQGNRAPILVGGGSVITWAYPV